MATGFPIGFVGPLPVDGYYSSTDASSTRSSPTSYPSSLGPGGRPVPVNGFYSNYDAPTLSAVVNSAPVPPIDPGGTITFSTDIGHFDKLVGDPYGVTSNTVSTVTIPSTETDVGSQTDSVLLVIPPNYQGNITVHETWTLPSAGSRDIIISVTRYDDGAYEATVHDLRVLGSPQGVPQGGGGAAQNQTGIKDGIDWRTLTSLGRNFLPDTDPGTGKQVITNGVQWQVKTVKGTTINVFEADPLAQQPAASRAIQSYQDPSYNCHGYSFGATGIICPDGKTRDFQIYDGGDVKKILADKYTKVTVDQAFAAAGTKKLFIIFFDAAGNPVHSAVNSPGQIFNRYRWFGSTTGIGQGTVVSSKNGDVNFQTTTTVKALVAIYPDDDIRIYTQKP